MSKKYLQRYINKFAGRHNRDMDTLDPMGHERIREAESRPAVSPRYEGMTPGEMARALLRPRNPKIARVLDKLRKRNMVYRRTRGTCACDLDPALGATPFVRDGVHTWATRA